MRPSKSFCFSMATFSAVTLCFASLCLLSVASPTPSFDEELYESSLFNIGSSVVCELARCLRGQCVNTSSFPFYKCECDKGWMSPFGSTWLPCILPNCSIDMTCGNTTSASPAPPPTAPLLGGLTNICSLPVCGNGVCVQNSSASNSSIDYDCSCDTGYVNLGNQSNGYCIRQCSIGADCANLGIPFGGASPPPPPSLSSPASSSSSNTNQGTSSSPPTSSEISSISKGQMNALQSRLLIVGTLGIAVMWA